MPASKQIHGASTINVESSQPSLYQLGQGGKDWESKEESSERSWNPLEKNKANQLWKDIENQRTTNNLIVVLDSRTSWSKEV